MVIFHGLVNPQEGDRYPWMKSGGLVDWFHRENLRETIDFPITKNGLSCNFSLIPIH